MKLEDVQVVSVEYAVAANLGRRAANGYHTLRVTAAVDAAAAATGSLRLAAQERVKIDALPCCDAQVVIASVNAAAAVACSGGTPPHQLCLCQQIQRPRDPAGHPTQCSACVLQPSLAQALPNELGATYRTGSLQVTMPPGELGSRVVMLISQNLG